MATSLTDFVLAAGWQDIAVASGYTAIAGQPCVIQGKTPGVTVEVFFSASGSAPSGNSGEIIGFMGSVEGTAQHVWVRSDDGAIVGVMIADAVSSGGGGGGGSSLADVSVVDAAGVYWLARDNGSGITYTNWATGAVGSPTAPVAPAGKLTGEQVNSVTYVANAASTGVAVGDVLVHDVIYNIATSPASIIASAWVNTTQGTILSVTPPFANLTQSAGSSAASPLAPLGAASINTGQGSATNAASLGIAARTGAAGTGAVSRTIFNTSGVTLYFGGAGVTAATGKSLPANASITLNTTAAIYVITGAGVATFDYVELF